MARDAWQKSTFSPDAGNCLYLAATHDGTIRLRESDVPNIIVTTTRENLKAFILGVKAGEFDHFIE